MVDLGVIPPLSNCFSSHNESVLLLSFLKHFTTKGQELEVYNLGPMVCIEDYLPQNCNHGGRSL